MYICIDTQDCASTGKTLNEAFQNYQRDFDTDKIDDCAFYEAEKIKVEIKIQRVETVVKASVKSA